VGLITNGNAQGFRSKLLERKDMTIDEKIQPDQIIDIIQKNKMDFVIVFEKDFDRITNEKKSGAVEIYYKGSRESDITKRRIDKALIDFEEELLSIRLKELNLEHTFLEPLNINENNLATEKERFGEVLGGFLPYIFVIFSFIGAMYPAIDLAAGEKERSTLETLLTSPASRMQIVLGKFLVVTLAGIISALTSILAIYLSMKQSKDIPSKAMETLLRVVDPQSIALLLSLLIPLCIFFSAVMLSFSIYAKSFKEAQSIMTPLNIIVIIPVAIGLFPGIKLSVTTALIPVLNVSLASREIISGTIKTGLLLETYLSLILLAAASLFFCSWWFKRESVIFRGK